MSAVYWRILEQYRQQISDFVNLIGEADVPRIKDSAIVIRRTPIRWTPKDDWGADEDTPGILISPSPVIDIPPTGGDIGNDDIYYPVLIQLINSERGRNDEKMIQSELQWAENIRKFCNQQNLRNKVWDSRGYVDLTLMINQDVLEERGWVLHSKCIGTFAVKVLSREMNNTQGSV